MTCTIHNGDALALLPKIPTESVDAIITDPPYSSGGMFRGDRTKATGDKYVIEQTGVEDQRQDFQGDSRDQRAFGYWCALWLGECHRIAKPGALLAVFCDWRQLPTMTDIIQAGGWVWRGIVPWNKTEASRPAKGWFRGQCEYILVAAKGVPARWADPTAPTLPGFFVCPVERENVHQTQKPVDLMRWICTLTPPGGTVLDPFAGSGSTGVGAIMEGRQFIGIELSAHYCAHATRRIAEADPVGRQLTIGEGV